MCLGEQLLSVSSEAGVVPSLMLEATVNNGTFLQTFSVVSPVSGHTSVRGTGFIERLFSCGFWSSGKRALETGTSLVYVRWTVAATKSRRNTLRAGGCAALSGTGRLQSFDGFSLGKLKAR